ncbi:hypothetical protein EU348_15965 [Chryseobacterium indologenes]|uniref:Uncharacterized protein n=1 Tax=Chryseobacterium indologenes TaxID=253 RepID=A0A411DQD3_CHRID|nr:hypothetical protein EU348_15965 [Chryseobacterium indologenes]
MGQINYYPASIIYYLLSIIYYLLSIIYYLLSIIYYLLLIAHYLWICCVCVCVCVWIGSCWCRYKTKKILYRYDKGFFKNKIKTGGGLLSRVSSTIGAGGLNFCVRNPWCSINFNNCSATFL